MYCLYNNIDVTFGANIHKLYNLKYIDDLVNGKLTNKGKNLFEEDTPENKFKELFYTYKFKVGGRPLRPANIDTKEAKGLQRKYIDIIKNKPGLHDTIMKALKNEIKTRDRDGSINYMWDMQKWMNNQLWDRFITDKEEEDIIKTTAI